MTARAVDVISVTAALAVGLAPVAIGIAVDDAGYGPWLMLVALGFSAGGLAGRAAVATRRLVARRLSRPRPPALPRARLL